MENEKDVHNLRGVILSESEQFEQGFKVAGSVMVRGEFDAIVLSGMGGSALPGDVLSVIIDDIERRYSPQLEPLRVHVNRSYALPRLAYHNSLNFVCSHSGNTEEALSVLLEVIKHKLPVVGISSGGKLEETCQEHGVPHVKLPIPQESFQPRMATGHFVSVILHVLIESDLLPDVRDELLKSAPELKQSVTESELLGKEIAETLVGKTPVVYASDKFKALAMIWKIKFNENAKTPAYWNAFPELNHNEMVGYTQPQADFSMLLLRDHLDNERNKKRYDVFGEIMASRGFPVRVLDIPGSTIYTQIFNTLVLGDWVSYYLALAYGMDPTPVDMVEDFKKRLVA